MKKKILQISHKFIINRCKNILRKKNFSKIFTESRFSLDANVDIVLNAGYIYGVGLEILIFVNAYISNFKKKIFIIIEIL